jgi:hypothetical protein
MINKEAHPVGWALLMYELTDAQEHLAHLIAQMESDPDYGEENFRIDMGHLYSHLNRAWHRRDVAEDLADDGFGTASEFPKDLEWT